MKKQLFLSIILLSNLALGSTVEILKHRLEDAKTMSIEKTMWGFGASKKEHALHTLLKDVEEEFKKEIGKLKTSILAIRFFGPSLTLQPGYSHERVKCMLEELYKEKKNISKQYEKLLISIKEELKSL